MQRAPSSCSPPRGVAADCAAQRAAEAISHSPPHSAKFVLGRAPRRPPTAFAARRERRFLSESRYSLFKRSMPTGFGGEAGSKRRYASLRCGRLRPARLCESQELGPKHHPILLGSGRALRGWAKGPARRPGGSTNRKGTTNSSAQHGAAQRTAQFSAPCPPHCGSAFAPPRAVARWDFISILLTAKRVKFLFKRAGDGFFVQGQVFFARRSLSARLARFSYIRLPPK